MAMPTLITVKGTYLKLDGTPETGTIQFISSVSVLKSGDRTAIAPSEVKRTLDSLGRFDIILPASNDPAWLPIGWTYKVILKLSGTYSTFNTVIPYNAINGEVFITDLLPAQPGGSALYAAFNHTHGTQYASNVHTHEASDIVSGTIALARLPVGVAPGTIAAGDHTHNYDSVYATINHNHDSVYSTIGHNHDSVYATLNHNHNYADLIGTPTLNKAAVGLENVDNTADAEKPVSTATTNALDLKLDKANPVISESTFTVKKANDSSGLRFRSTGGAVDVDKMNGDVVVSSFAGPVFSGTQTGLQRWRNDGSTFAGLTEFGDTVYGGQQSINGTTGVAKLGAKNSLTNITFAGYRNAPGSPTTGAWAVGDTVYSTDGVWRCITAGTPGTWQELSSNARANGLLDVGEEIIPRKDVSFQLQMTSGTFFLSDFVARKTENITKIRTGISDASTAGVGGSHAWVAVYSFDGTNYNLVAQSADTPALWSSAFQVYETPLTTTFNKVAGVSYAIGLLWVGSGQAPSLPGSQAWYADTLLTPRVCSVFFDQTALPNPLPAAFTGPDSRKYQAIMLP